jgi:two-component sensor histidine kinase
MAVDEHDSKHAAQEVPISSDDQTPNSVRESDHIIANLSHSIKNLLNSSVISPLRNIHTLDKRDEEMVREALRGAELIGQIVVAMNMSYRGSEEDYRYDAIHPDTDSASMAALIREAFHSSIANIFDGKHFRSVQMAYFPDNELYLSAYREWKTIRCADDWEPLTACIRKHFFDFEIDLEQGSSLVLGNTKHSRVKMLILLQEMVFNAVKYAGFVARNRRELHFTLSMTPEQITITLENSFDPEVRYMTSGIGHAIIENFARLLNTVPVITRSANRFTITLTFRNLWED